MNKIGFGELLIILIIALVVLGPEKLPQAARALGKAIGSVKKYVREASKELELDELKQIKKDVVGIQQDLRSMGDSIEKSITTEADQVEQGIDAVTQDVNDAVENDPPAAKKPQAEPAKAEPESVAEQPAEETSQSSVPSVTADGNESNSQEE